MEKQQGLRIESYSSAVEAKELPDKTVLPARAIVPEPVSKDDPNYHSVPDLRPAKMDWPVEREGQPESGESLVEVEPVTGQPAAENAAAATAAVEAVEAVPTEPAAAGSAAGGWPVAPE